MPVHRNADEQHEGGDLHDASRRLRALAQVAGSRRLQRDPRGTRRHEHGQPEHSAQKRERRDEPEQGHAGVVSARIHRDARVDVADRNAEQQRRQKRADEEACVPQLRPRLVATGELDRHRAQDEPEQNEHDGQVKARERGRVRGGERREQRAAGREQPHLVAIPYRADCVADERALFIVLGDERVEHARAQIEAVEHEIPRDEQEDEEVPQHAENRHATHRLPHQQLRGRP